MQPAVYFLNRMSELQQMKRQRAGLWANPGYSAERRDRGRRSPGESWISHTAPWTFLWLHRGSDMELFHLIAAKCPGDVGNSDNMRMDVCCICMWAILNMRVNTSQACGSHTRHPLETLTKTTLVFQSPSSPQYKASMVSGCQVIFPSSSNNDCN